MTKKSGVSKRLDVSDELAKIIGTKKGQRVILSHLPMCFKLCRTGVQVTGGEEAVRLPQREKSQGDLPLSLKCGWKLYASLQDPENKAFFTPDKTMQPIYGSSKQKHLGMIHHCKGHLTDPKK